MKLTNIRGAGGGGKGGGGGGSPTTDPDTLHNVAAAKVLDLVSEGPIKGLVTGDARSIIIDGTPVQNEDGTQNWGSVGWEMRHGTQDQSYIPGFPSVENEMAVGVELRSTPITREITNSIVTSVRLRFRLPSLQSYDDKGNNRGATVGFRIELAQGTGPFVEVRSRTISEKSSGEYSFSETVSLPQGGAPWRVRVVRTTPNSTDGRTADQMYLDALIEIIDAKLRYPNSAIFGVQVDAETFSSVPSRGYHLYGIICRVPTNYDPDTRTYTGIWDGSFKQAWTNNPVWVMYTIIGHPRYGLKDRVTYADFDIWNLYEVARFCDELVPDGRGGQEPRYTVNTWITGRMQGYEFLASMASIFKGMGYELAGNIMLNADMPRLVDTKPYTNSNAENGVFSYAGPEAHTRYTAAAVSWNNPDNLYQKEVAYVEADPDVVFQLGHQLTEFEAFGTTSEGQAIRAGNWALLTSEYESNIVRFVTTLEALRNVIGDVIPIADANRSKSPGLAGRIVTADLNSITVDRDPQAQSEGSDIIVAMPSGYAEVRKIQSVNGRVIRTTTPFSAIPQFQGTWVIDGEVQPQLFRIIKVDNLGKGRFEIVGVEYAEGKHSAIENRTRIEPRNTINPEALQVAPESITLTSGWSIDQGIAIPRMTVYWPQAAGATSYEGAWREAEGDWIRFGPQGMNSFDVDGIRTGNYEAWVRAIGATGAKSKLTRSILTAIEGKNEPPPAVVSFEATGEVMAIRLNWRYSQAPGNTEFAEIRMSLNNSFSNSTVLTNLAYPTDEYTIQNLRNDAQMWFWIRLIDKNGLQGPWTPGTGQPGLLGRPDQDPGNLLSYMQGKIGESELVPGLKESIIQEATDNAVEIAVPEAVGIARDEMVDFTLGDLAGDSVSDDRWFAGDDSTSNNFVGTITVTSNQILGDYYQAKQTRILTASMDDNMALIREDLEVLVDADSALATQITQLGARVDDDVATIYEALQVNTDAISANATAIQTVTSEFNDNIAQVRTEIATVADATSATATALQTLKVETDQNLAQVRSEISVVSDETSANATAINALSVQTANEIASANSRIDAAVSDNSATLSLVQTLSAETSTALASVNSRVDVVATDTAANTTAIQTLSASTGDSLATINTALTTLSDETQANASAITHVQANLDDTAAAAQTTANALATLDGKLQATWQTKLEVRSDGRVVETGVAMGAVINPDGTYRSEILMMADTIAFLTKLNGNLHSPFIWDVANDTGYLDTVYIKDGTIGTAAITDAAITRAKIGNAAIGSAQIEDAAITAAKIGDAQITNAKIGYAQVDTLKVAGNSITVLAVTSAPVQPYPSNTSRNIDLSIYLTVSAHAVVTVNVSDLYGYSSSLNTYRVINVNTGAEIHKFSTAAMFFSEPANNNVVMGGQFSVAITLPAGTTTIRVIQPRVGEAFPEVFLRIEAGMR